jgi:hypothetical protein
MLAGFRPASGHPHLRTLAMPEPTLDIFTAAPRAAVLSTHPGRIS